MQERQKNFYEFGAFRLDAEECLLLREGEPVRLQAKAFDTLLLLVQNSGHLITKDELLEKVWADSFVEENNLTKNIHALRKALNGEGEEFIETVPRRGYRFRANVRVVSADENLLIENRTKYRLVVEEEFTETNAPKFTRGKFAYLVAALGIAALVVGFAVNNLRNAESKSPMLGAANAEAFEEYRQGRALWQTREGENLHRATVLFESAVQKDPYFALAHAALADSYAFDYRNWKKAESEATEAIRLNPNLGEPHASIGFVRMFWEWNLKEAEAEFRQSVRLSPNYATGHQWYALNLASSGHNDAAFIELTRALELDPNSVSINTDMCQVLYFMRKYDEAIARCKKSLVMNPNFLNAYLYLYEIYNAAEMWEEVVETERRIDELSNSPIPGASEKLREAYKKGGIQGFWQARIDIYSKTPSHDYKMAQHYARLGEKDKSLYWLKEAYKNRDFDFILVAADPVFQGFRSDDDYYELMKMSLFPEN